MEMRNKQESFFLVLIFLTLMGIGIVAAGVWYLPVVGITSITRIVLSVIGLIISLILLTFAIGFGSVVVTLIKEKPISWLVLPTRLTIEYLFPVTIYIGQLFGYSREELQGAFIQISNHLVGIKGIKVEGDEILILLPHCIQKYDCRYKVTSEIDNCRRCGQCDIDDLLQLKDKYGCHLAVATGGTLARKLIKELRPKAIVAVACERDLTSGIQDTYPLPVRGVTNIRPEGPCVNTLVDVDKVEKAILEFMGRKGE